MLLTDKVSQFATDSNTVHAWVNGPASGIGSTVTTDSGLVRTPAKLIADNQANFDVITALVDRVKTTDLAAPAGASLVGFMPAGIGAVATTLQAKNREFVSVFDKGATGTGENATTAFANAFASGKAVYAPAGTYLLDFLNMPSNSFLYGDGPSTIIMPLTPTTRCALGAESASASTFIENITIRDVKFLGTVANNAFSEQHHLTSFNGVKNMLVENCHFVGFRGDGVYLGSGNTFGAERHNINVSIRNCFFDGVNKDNRNAISIIDGTGITIDGNYFTRCTRVGMPAAIDVEPNNNSFHVVRHITITNNVFDDVRSGIAMLMVNNMTVPPFGFLIENNTVRSASGVGIGVNFSFATTPNTQATKSMNIRVIGNRVESSAAPFTTNGVVGMTVDGNTFVDCTEPCAVGSGAFARVLSFDVKFTNNIIERCGTAGGASVAGVVCDGITNLTLNGNTFIDCGDNIVSSGCGVLFKPSFTSAVSNITFKDNQFYKTAALTNMAATRLTTSTISYSYENISGNQYGSLASIFLADSGTWTPTLSFATPGDLSVSYSTRTGTWTRSGKMVTVKYEIVTSALTYTTASSAVVISGLPAPVLKTSYGAIAAYAGITKAGYTTFSLGPRTDLGGLLAWVWGSGSGQAFSTVTTTSIPTTSVVLLNGEATYAAQL